MKELTLKLINLLLIIVISISCAALEGVMLRKNGETLTSKVTFYNTNSLIPNTKSISIYVIPLFYLKDELPIISISPGEELSLSLPSGLYIFKVICLYERRGRVYKYIYVITNMSRGYRVLSNATIRINLREELIMANTWQRVGLHEIVPLLYQLRDSGFDLSDYYHLINECEEICVKATVAFKSRKWKEYSALRANLWSKASILKREIGILSALSPMSTTLLFVMIFILSIMISNFLRHDLANHVSRVFIAFVSFYFLTSLQPDFRYTMKYVVLPAFSPYIDVSLLYSSSVTILLFIHYINDVLLTLIGKAKPKFHGLTLVAIRNVYKRKLRTAIEFSAILVTIFSVVTVITMKTHYSMIIVNRRNTPYMLNAVVIEPYLTSYLPQDVYEAALSLSMNYVNSSWFQVFGLSSPLEDQSPRLLIVKNDSRARFFGGVLGVSASIGSSVYNSDKVCTGWFSRDCCKEIIVSSEVARLLDLKAGDYVNLYLLKNGKIYKLLGSFKVVGSYNASLFTIKDVNGLDILYFTPFKDVILMPLKTAVKLGLPIRRLVLTFSSPDKAQEVAFKVCSLNVTVWYVSNGVSSEVGRSPTILAKGLEVSVIPLFISALMVLNFILASIYERIRDFKTMSSIGFSPSDIMYAVLAESIILVMLPSFIGYILSVLAVREAKVGPLYSLLVFSSTLLLILIGGYVPSKLASCMVTPSRKLRFSLEEIASKRKSFYETTLPIKMTVHEIDTFNRYVLEKLRHTIIDDVTLELSRVIKSRDGISYMFNASRFEVYSTMQCELRLLIEDNNVRLNLLVKPHIFASRFLKSDVSVVISAFRKAIIDYTQSSRN